MPEKRHRDAKTGQFVTKQTATRRPATTVSETVKKTSTRSSNTKKK